MICNWKKAVFVADILSISEYMSDEVPLAQIQRAIFDFLRAREDVVTFGAQAVNAYVPDEPRMTQDVDLLALEAMQIAESLKTYLHERFHIAVRVREVAGGQGFRVYQVRKPPLKNRNLIDIRSVKSLPPTRKIDSINILDPVYLISMKLISYQERRNQPKGPTDLRDLRMLLITFPELKTDQGPVRDCLMLLQANAETLALWQEVVAQEIELADDEDEFV
jgi:hypothetical protein